MKNLKLSVLSYCSKVPLVFPHQLYHEFSNIITVGDLTTAQLIIKIKVKIKIILYAIILVCFHAGLIENHKIIISEKVATFAKKLLARKTKQTKNNININFIKGLKL
jgi:hypothetical protein